MTKNLDKEQLESVLKIVQENTTSMIRKIVSGVEIHLIEVALIMSCATIVSSIGFMHNLCIDRVLEQVKEMSGLYESLINEHIGMPKNRGKEEQLIREMLFSKFTEKE